MSSVADTCNVFSCLFDSSLRILCHLPFISIKWPAVIPETVCFCKIDNNDDFFFLGVCITIKCSLFSLVLYTQNFLAIPNWKKEVMYAMLTTNLNSSLEMLFGFFWFISQCWVSEACYFLCCILGTCSWWMWKVVFLF